MPPPEDLERMVRAGRETLQQYGIEVNRPQSVESHFFTSPELWYRLGQDKDADIEALVREDNTIEFIDVAFAAYNFRDDTLLVNHGLIKTHLLGLLLETRADLPPDDGQAEYPANPYAFYTRSRLETSFPSEVVDAWLDVKEQAESLGLNPQYDLNIWALSFDSIRYDGPQPLQTEANSIYTEQVRTDVEHELLHKYQFQHGIPPHVGEIVNTIWSVERAPIYRLLDEATEENLAVAEMALDTIKDAERFGLEGIATDAVEFLDVYNSFRGDEDERLARLLALQHEFIPQYDSQDDDSGVIRSIIKALIMRAIVRLVF